MVEPLEDEPDEDVEEEEERDEMEEEEPQEEVLEEEPRDSPGLDSQAESRPFLSCVAGQPDSKGAPECSYVSLSSEVRISEIAEEDPVDVCLTSS